MPFRTTLLRPSRMVTPVGQEPGALAVLGRARFLGNEITDALRAAGASGDGRAVPDGSTGVWAATTNLLLQGNHLATAPWTASGCSVIEGVAGDPYGNAALNRVTLAGAGDTLGQTVAVLAGKQYSFSFWAQRGTAGDGKYRVYDQSNGADIIAATGYFSSTSAGGLSRIAVTFTTPAGCTSVAVYPLAGSCVTGTWLLWRVQLELCPIATPYVDTGGSTATRAGGGVLLPRAGIVDPARGWVAVRCRANYVSTAQPTPALFPYLFCVSEQAADNDGLHISYSIGAQAWHLDRKAAGENTHFLDVAGTFAAGDLLTTVLVWDPGSVGFALNGAAVQSAANANLPALSAAQVAVGYQDTNGGSYSNFDYFWCLVGAGTLSAAAQAAIAGWGNAAPAPEQIAMLGGACVPTLLFDGASGATWSFV